MWKYTLRIAILASSPGRNPYCCGSRSASKIGPSTTSMAPWTTRSRIDGMPSGRWPPFCFGIQTRSRPTKIPRRARRISARTSSSRRSPLTEELASTRGGLVEAATARLDSNDSLRVIGGGGASIPSATSPPARRRGYPPYPEDVMADIVQGADSCIYVCMRTTLNLRDDLVEKAAALSGLTEKTALVHAGLEALMAQEAAKRLARLGGVDKRATSGRRRRPTAA